MRIEAVLQRRGEQFGCGEVRVGGEGTVDRLGCHDKHDAKGDDSESQQRREPKFRPPLLQLAALLRTLFGSMLRVKLPPPDGFGQRLT
jgi:hypothetical protein